MFYHKKILLLLYFTFRTPDKLMGFVEKKRISFEKLQYLVLFEADLMMDNDFDSKLFKIFSHPSMPNKDNRQSLVFTEKFPLVLQHLLSNLNNQLFITEFGKMNQFLSISYIYFSISFKRGPTFSCF